jgi:L-fuculose-phosphate aldolase
MGELPLADAKALICAFGRRMITDRLVVGTSGNISVRAHDMVTITPSGVEYAELAPAAISVVDADGRLIEGEPPSSELPLHLALYGTGTHAVVHTHSPHATAAGLVTDEIPPIHYLLAMFNGPVRVAPYATFGTEELAAATTKAIEDRYGCLLANHGAVTIGRTLEAAYDRAIQLEWLCQVWLTAKNAGELRLLPDGELDRVNDRIQHYGAAAREPRPRQQEQRDL